MCDTNFYGRIECVLGMDHKGGGNIILDYRGVTICQDSNIVFDNFDLVVEGGEFVYLTGPVGVGKSTLLKTMYAEVPIVGGDAQLLGFDLRRLKRNHVFRLRRNMGIIFQDFQLLSDCTAYENLDIVLRALGYKVKRDRAVRIELMLNQVGLETKGYKYPHELSGGEQQRIAIARALLGEPILILADEPTANLDTESGLQIADLLHRLAREYGVAVIMATHNPLVLERYPARVIDIKGV